MQINKISVSVLFLIVFLIYSKSAEADVFYKEINLIGGYSDNQHWIGRKEQVLKNSIGFEYFKKLSNEYGDYLTADLQMRLSYDSLGDSNDAWALEVHNAWLEYMLGLSSKVRIGHFDVPFGLEPLLDTHGTLFQTLAMKNIGFKKDWGIAYRGILGDYDYEVAGQLGSGMGIKLRDNNHLVSGRIGSSINQNFQYGLSLLYGRTLEFSSMQTIPAPDLASEQTVLKKRVGFDSQYIRGPYEFKGELAFGEDNQNKVAGLLLQVDYTVPKLQQLTFQLQGESWVADLKHSRKQDFTLAAGASYKINQNCTVRLGYFHDIYSRLGNQDKQVLFQVYLFGF